MAQEIERKFACKYIPKEFKPSIIKQGYIFIEKERYLRIRIIDNKMTILGLKFISGIVRDEYEYAVPFKDGMELYKRCEIKIEKKRYSTKFLDCQVDIDDFGNGIQVIEIELPSIDYQLNVAALPDYFGKEVTGEKKYSNFYIATLNSGK